MAAYLFSNFPRLSEAGMAGYSFISTNQTFPINDTTTVQVAGVLCEFALINSTDPNEVAALFAPILEHVNATWPTFFPIFENTTYASYYDWYADNYDKGAAGDDTFVGSHLLDEHALTSDLTALAEAYRDMSLLSGGGGATAYLVGGKGVHNAQPRGGGDSINPGWRTAYVHGSGSNYTKSLNFADGFLANGASMSPLNLTSRDEALQNLNSSLVKVRALAPTLGAYINEVGYNNGHGILLTPTQAHPNEPNWQSAFWGDNYPRLLDIKRQVDPDDVLWCHPCVGNERWQVEGDALCRV